jgi:hypothetical protein
MKITAPISFDRGSEQVEAMMEQGMPFACVEDVIDGARLSREHKAALWLLAWSLRDPMLQRDDARVTVRMVRASGLGGVMAGPEPLEKDLSRRPRQPSLYPAPARRAGRSLRRFEVWWLSPQERELTRDDRPHFRAHPLEFDERGLPIYRSPLTWAGSRDGS